MEEVCLGLSPAPDGDGRSLHLHLQGYQLRACPSFLAIVQPHCAPDSLAVGTTALRGLGQECNWEGAVFQIRTEGCVCVCVVGAD